VIVEVRSGAVVIESHGKALADGRTGDMVPVRLSGAELLRGRVVGAKRLAL
jgi:flagella basal body P-ring formation protein FlgA